MQLELFPRAETGSEEALVCIGRAQVPEKVPGWGEQAQEAERAAIYEAASIMASSLNTEEVYQWFASEVRRLVDFDRMSVILVEDASQMAVRMHTAGLDPDILKSKPRWPMDGSVVEWVLRHRQSLLQGDLSRQSILQFVEDPVLLQAGFRSGVRVPLAIKNRVIGMLAVWSQRPDRYSLREQSILERLAAQIAPAIENARLYGQAQETLESLRSAQEQLVRLERLRAMGELASGVAHDFNNSLAAILGRTQLLMNQITYGPHLESLYLIERAARDSAQVVRRILDFARFDADVELSSVDVNQLVEDVVALTRHKWWDEAQSKGQTIQIRKHLGDVPPALGNYAELREVLANLMINAYEAISGDGVIDITTHSSPERVLISVADTGVGMRPELAQKIFAPFFTTKGSRGTGLGLSVALGIISKYNGTIEVDSREGMGTTMRASLPIAAPAPQPKEPEAPTAPEPSRAVDILVIEDEPMIRQTMADILSLDGHGVTVAKDGEEGISLFKAGKYDVVFTDLGMPGLSGWEVAKAIKQHRGDVPVIMVTGWGVAIDPSEVERRGIDGVLAKPFDIDVLSKLVHRLAEQRALLPPGNSPSEAHQASRG